MSQATKGVEVLGIINCVDRPQIRLENLNLSNLTINDIPTDGKFYDGICIPLKFSDKDRILWELVWNWFVDKYAEDSGEGEIIEDQPINLQLYIADNPATDAREYALSAFVPINYYGDETDECLTEDIHLTPEEVKAVNKVLSEKVFSEAANYMPQEEKPVISKPKLTFGEFCRKYGNRTNETTRIKPTAFDLYKELKNPNYNSFVIVNQIKAKEEAEHKVPAFGITHLKKIRFEKCYGTDPDKLRLTDGKAWFKISGPMESIERTREFGNFQDVFTIKFQYCDEPLELVADWAGNEIE